MRLVYLIGVDGSGKTTLAHSLVAEARRSGQSARYFYARHFPVLLQPAKLLARASVMRGTSEFGNYEEYSQRKTERSKQLRWFARAYGALWAADYVALTWLRMLPLLLFRGCTVVDRYHMDVAVNIATALDLSDERLVRLASRLASLFPRPNSYVFIDIPPAAAFERKSDIPSVLYLEERRRRYLLLAEEFGFTIVDGRQTPEALTSETFDLLMRRHGERVHG